MHLGFHEIFWACTRRSSWLKHAIDRYNLGLGRFLAQIFVISCFDAPEMLAVIFYGLEVVYGFRERRMCRSDFSETVSLETERSCSFIVFGHWGMFAALAYGDVRLGLKIHRGAQW